MKGLLRSILLATCAATCIATGALAQANSISAEQWSAYRDKFLDASGRIIDNANGDISHSEGQGYGLLLAFLAGNRGDFDRIWSFTRSEMLLRDDGLSVWKWDPRASPKVTDTNNASDGDMLIAYALAMAGSAWGRQDLTTAATQLANALGRSVMRTRQGRFLLMPAVAGFGASDREDGPIVNLSYWVFEALPVLATLAPGVDWNKLSADGVALLEQTIRTSGALPPDWLSLRARPKPAIGFPPEFGYNSVRIPLYLMRAGNADGALLTALRDGMAAADGSVRLVNVLTGAPAATLSDPGYRVIPAMISCVVDGTTLPADLKTFVATDYYPSTLHLLALSFANRRHKECL